ncbi:epl1 protein [Fistulina hepatica ATCC 64428]|uniref:Epl1 protein n=1 Tax=Fistulina hepatica ATCC 64428 TaxID=1128425 RepID=A0A0D7AH64_9AGAR|nr:epl1 protein [Fistulina hepatica ATCC 64428]
MKFLAAFSALLAAAATAAAVSLSYDQTYDGASTSLTTVACSDGTHGLITEGYSTFGSLPDFPYIGGADAITGWNSANCGTCWTLYYPDTGRSINVLAIDHADSGFNIALEAMNDLTNNQAVFLGRIDVTATQVAVSNCGL